MMRVKRNYNKYNGLDYTRPDQRVTLRLRFQISSSPTTQTNLVIHSS